MDYRHRENALAVAILMVIMIVSIVVIANWNNISHRGKTNKNNDVTISEDVAEVQVSEERDKKQVGYDLSAWKNDNSFFDSGKTVEEIEKRIITETTPVKPNRNDKTGREEN